MLRPVTSISLPLAITCAFPHSSTASPRHWLPDLSGVLHSRITRNVITIVIVVIIIAVAVIPIIISVVAIIIAWVIIVSLLFVPVLVIAVTTFPVVVLIVIVIVIIVSSSISRDDEREFYGTLQWNSIPGGDLITAAASVAGLQTSWCFQGGVFSALSSGSARPPRAVCLLEPNRFSPRPAVTRPASTPMLTTHSWCSPPSARPSSSKPLPWLLACWRHRSSAPSMRSSTRSQPIFPGGGRYCLVHVALIRYPALLLQRPPAFPSLLTRAVGRP